MMTNKYTKDLVAHTPLAGDRCSICALERLLDLSTGCSFFVDAYDGCTDACSYTSTRYAEEESAKANLWCLFACMTDREIEEIRAYYL